MTISGHIPYYIIINHTSIVASNILLKMKCPCTKPLMCSCPQKYLVKLGDFDSSTTIPGFGLKIEPHQMIRYASVLPLGTMGYRAPEVRMSYRNVTFFTSFLRTLFLSEVDLCVS